MRPRETRTDASGYAYVVPVLGDFRNEPGPFRIRCTHPRCRREVALTVSQAIALLGEDCTVEAADRRLRCSACGARGADGFIVARFDPPGIPDRR